MATIQPGLERISQLVKNVRFPWKAIHVAGTNGKGSISHYASSLLTRKSVRCGKFTSPHLVDRWDCISIQNKTVNKKFFRRIEQHYIRLSDKHNINASPFEILTATAFHIFTQEKVDIGIVEVGMGGKLDATNILQNQAISVISKIARDHETFLGTTLEQIALHKAGILRPNIPYVVNPSNERNVHDVIDQYAKEIEAGPRLTGDTPQLRLLYSTSAWLEFARRLPPFQRDNAVLAMVAAMEATKSLGHTFFPSQIASKLQTIKTLPLPGRCEDVYVQPVFGHMNIGRRILVDGAHNEDAAIALNKYVHVHQRLRTIHGRHPPEGEWPVTWVFAMTEGKDARQYLKHLLKPGDNVVTTSFGPVDGMPWVKPMDPKELLDIAESVQPGISGVHIPEGGPMRALCAAKHLVEDQQPIVLTGSLYLIGDLYRELRARTGAVYWTDQNPKDRAMFEKMLEEERIRVKLALSRTSVEDPDPSASIQMHLTEEQKRRAEERERRRLMQEQIRALDEELKRLEEAEQSISPLPSVASAATQFTSEISSKSKGQDKKPRAASTTSLKQQYAKSLDEIRAKLHALQASASIAPKVNADAEVEKTRDATPVVTKEDDSEERAKGKSGNVSTSATTSDQQANKNSTRLL